MPFATTWTDLEIIILSEVRQKDKYMISLTCGIFLNNDTNVRQKTTKFHKAITLQLKNKKILKIQMGGGPKMAEE